LSHQHTSLQAIADQLLLQHPRLIAARHHGLSRTVLATQPAQLGNAIESCQGESLVALGMAGTNVQRTQPDGACRSEHRYLQGIAHQAPHPASHNRTANTGTAAVRLSIRSMTLP